MTDPAAELQETKQRMRQAHTAGRRLLVDDTVTKTRVDEAIVAHTAECMRHFGAAGNDIAAYSPLPSEPGPLDYPAKLSAYAARVWLPISLDDGRLAWSLHREGASAPGALGITEPSGERHDASVLRGCALVVVPALAVDRSGMRLGKGRGYYDRALAGLEVPVAAVVFHNEVVDQVPHDHLDAPVDAVITPSGFFLVEGTAAR